MQFQGVFVQMLFQVVMFTPHLSKFGNCGTQFVLEQIVLINCFGQLLLSLSCLIPFVEAMFF